VIALQELHLNSSEALQVPLTHFVRHMLRRLPNIPDERIARGHLATFETRQLCATIWAFGRLGLHSRALYEAAALKLLRRRHEVADKGLVELADVFSQSAVQTLTQSHSAVLYMVATEAATRVRQASFVPNALAQVLWALWSASQHASSTPLMSSEALANRRLAARAGAVRKNRDLGGAQVLEVPGAVEAPAGEADALATQQVLNVNVTEALLDDTVRNIVLELSNLSHTVRTSLGPYNALRDTLRSRRRPCWCYTCCLQSQPTSRRMIASACTRA
jgi:hypothetical protein